MPQHNDHPFYDAAKEAQAWMKMGHTIHQKFTCARCGVRQTISEPNKFFTKGVCEECGHETDIEAQGCNYLLVTRVSAAH
jgi:transcription elongation factor Elf1